jgi:hypothetical protein
MHFWRGTPFPAQWNELIRMLTPLTDKEEMLDKSNLRIRGVKKLNNATELILEIRLL